MDLLSGPAPEFSLPHAAPADAVLPPAPAAARAAAYYPAQISLSFTITGLKASVDNEQSPAGGWGGLKKAINQVVGERQGSWQITLGE